MPEEVPQGTIAEVLAWVGDDPARAQAALDAENAGAGRTTLLNQLKVLVTPAPPEEEPEVSETETTSDKNGEFVAEGADAQEAGYWGTRDNPFPDEAFALTTGPDAPLTDMLGNPVDLDEHIQAEPPAE